MKIGKKTKTTIFIIAGIMAVIVIILLILKALKDKQGVVSWMQNINQLKQYTVQPDIDTFSFENYPDNLKNMVDWAIENYPKQRNNGEYMNEWLSRQSKWAIDNASWLTKLFI